MKYGVIYTGDGYVSFREVVSNMLLAECYALSLKDVWRFRAPGQLDKDFVPPKAGGNAEQMSHSAKGDAVTYATAYVKSLGYSPTML